MSKSVVALVPCHSYDEEVLYPAVRRGLALLGGLSTFLSPEQRILLKPNLLSRALPQRAITTGQTVALYDDGGRVLAGGTIRRVEPD